MIEQSPKQTPLSQQDFLALGLDQLAYMKPVVIDGQKLVAIHSADGNQLGTVTSLAAAWAAIRQNDLEPVSLN
jgi:hypothetical protein